MTVDTHNKDCTVCDAKQSVKSKIYSYKGRITQIMTSVCYECGGLSPKQQDLIDEVDDD